MSIMAFSQMRGDLSNIGEDFAIAREKYTSHGAQRVSASVALTGASAGSLTLTTIWDSADACFSARAAVTSDPDVQAMLARNQSEPIGFMLGQITGEIGTCEGSMGIGVLATATDNSQEAIDAVLAVQDRIIVSPGNNGMRQVRMIAAGEMTGVYANIVYTESVDAYFNASAAAWQDSEFVALSQKIGAQIIDRSVFRTV